MSDYAAFLALKAQLADSGGSEPVPADLDGMALLDECAELVETLDLL